MRKLVAVAALGAVFLLPGVESDLADPLAPTTALASFSVGPVLALPALCAPCLMLGM
jgi:hypothetical protein